MSAMVAIPVMVYKMVRLRVVILSTVHAAQILSSAITLL